MLTKGMSRPPSRLKFRRSLAVTGVVLFAAAGLVGVSGPASAAAGVGVEVPNLRLLDRASAISEITGAGLVVGTITEVNNCVDPGTVQSQNPKAGRVVVFGSAVSFKLSTCTGGNPQ